MKNNGVLGLIQRGRNHGIAIWLGLFAMLMIHVGPLISGTQALIQMDAASRPFCIFSARAGPHPR